MRRASSHTKRLQTRRASRRALTTGSLRSRSPDVVSHSRRKSLKTPRTFNRRPGRNIFGKSSGNFIELAERASTDRTRLRIRRFSLSSSSTVSTLSTGNLMSTESLTDII